MDNQDSNASQALSPEAKELEEHFQIWAVTPKDTRILKQILSRLLSKQTNTDGGMTLVFKASWYEHVTEQTDDDGNRIWVFNCAIEDEETVVKRTPPEITVEFGPPAPEKVTADDSASVLEAAKLHGAVRFAHVSGGEFCWEPHGVRFEYGYENYNDDPGEGFDSLEDRYPCLACANQNYFLLDRAKKNAAGEPLIVLFLAMVRDYELENHDGSFDEMDIFDGKHQQEDPYGIGGFLLRVIGAYILEDTHDFENCGMG